MTTQSKSGAQIAITTLPNLRDLGGWPTQDDRRARSGLMYRSTDLDRLDAAGVDAVAKLRLRTVVDLRTKSEREAHPDHVPAGAVQLVCDVLADAKDSAPAQLPKIYVGRYVPDHNGENFVAHMTAGLAPLGFLEEFDQQPFDSFDFHPAGIAVYQLGNNGTARRE